MSLIKIKTNKSPSKAIIHKTRKNWKEYKLTRGIMKDFSKATKGVSD